VSVHFGAHTLPGDVDSLVCSQVPHGSGHRVTPRLVRADWRSAGCTRVRVADTWNFLRSLLQQLEELFEDVAINLFDLDMVHLVLRTRRLVSLYLVPVLLGAIEVRGLRL
jgi:hypothetical protein